MENTNKSLTSLRDLLTKGEVHSTLSMYLRNGDLNRAADFLNDLFKSKKYKFDKKEPNFDLEFPFLTGKIKLHYNGNGKLKFDEPNLNQDKGNDLPSRIKRGAAEIEEIERALLDGSLQFEQFKEVTEHLETHVSDDYRIKLLHVGKVYETKDRPSIKVTYIGDGHLLTEEEEEREKKERLEKEKEEKENEKIKDRKTTIDAENKKKMLEELEVPETFQQQLDNMTIVEKFIRELGDYDDKEIEILVGEYEVAKLILVEDYNKLAIKNDKEVSANIFKAKEEFRIYTDSFILVESELNNCIKDKDKIIKNIFDDVELDPELQTLLKELIDNFEKHCYEQVKKGKSFEEVTVEYIEKAKIELLTKKRALEKKYKKEPEKDKTQQVNSKEDEKEILYNAIKAKIIAGVPPQVIIRNLANNKYAQEIVQRLISDQVITPENYPSLKGYEIANDLTGNTLIIEQVMDNAGNLSYITNIVPTLEISGPTMKKKPGED